MSARVGDLVFSLSLSTSYTTQESNHFCAVVRDTTSRAGIAVRDKYIIPPGKISTVYVHIYIYR